MLRQNLQADMLLGNAFHRGSQSREIVDVACVSENSGRQRARLRARVAMMRLIEEITDHRIFKHRSEEHTSELQSLMRNSSAVFCLKKKIHEKSYLISNT